MATSSRVSWHDFDTEEGEQFMAKMGIKQHVPLVIWIDGTPKVTVGVKQITFRRLSHRIRPCLLSRQMDLGRPEGRPQSGHGQKVRMP